MSTEEWLDIDKPGALRITRAQATAAVITGTPVYAYRVAWRDNLAVALHAGPNGVLEALRQGKSPSGVGIVKFYIKVEP